MKQIILTVEDNLLVPKLKAAVKMLQGVVSVKVADVFSSWQEVARKPTAYH